MPSNVMSWAESRPYVDSSCWRSWVLEIHTECLSIPNSRRLSWLSTSIGINQYYRYISVDTPKSGKKPASGNDIDLKSIYLAFRLAYITAVSGNRGRRPEMFTADSRITPVRGGTQHTRSAASTLACASVDNIVLQ